jgi:crossover junction endodeoxyribonuclease RuvC
MTLVMGVDPGLTRCGVGVVRSGRSRLVEFVAVETITSDKDLELSERIGQIATRIETLILTHQPKRIALERVFSQANLRSVMGTAQISGVVFFLAHKHGIPIQLHTPTEVKAAVTGSGRAAKAQVGEMVKRILKLEEVPKPADAADSLAIAICNAWRTSDQSVGSQQTSAQQVWKAAIAASHKKSHR